MVWVETTENSGKRVMMPLNKKNIRHLAHLLWELVKEISNAFLFGKGGNAR